MKTRLPLIIKDTAPDEALLESLVRSLDSLPENALRLFDVDLLPGPLERLAKDSGSGKVWCCWQLEGRLWFYLADNQSRQKGPVVMQVTSFDPEGEIVENGCWIRAQTWQQL